MTGAVLVTGAAGYIGAHVVAELRRAGHRVVAVDDLSAGFPERLPSDDLHELDLASPTAPDAIAQLLRRHEVDVVVHLAALKDVGESMTAPERYYRVNVLGTLQVLEGMRDAGVRRIVFSSTAAVYGDVDSPAVDEAFPREPINPYGRSKVVGEWMLEDAARAWGLRWLALRYFNVAGAARPELRDRVAKNLVPLVVGRLSEGQDAVVYGDDHPTRDGTCVRDYLHVADLAEAHVAAVAALRAEPLGLAVNLGTGSGSTVREVVDAVAAELGVAAEPHVVGRRDGDPAAMVADASRAAQVLGWQARRQLRDIVRSST